MPVARRFVVFQAFLLWQGGFLFYSSVVVPVGTEFLQSSTLQGMITQRVTNWMNLCGVVWLTTFAWDVWATADPVRRRRQARWLGWFACLVLLGLLAWVHTELDARIDPEAERVREKTAFRLWHEAYLWGVTGHWVIALALAWLTLSAWRAEDRGMADRVGHPRPARRASEG